MEGIFFLPTINQELSAGQGIPSLRSRSVSPQSLPPSKVFMWRRAGRRREGGKGREGEGRRGKREKGGGGGGYSGSEFGVGDGTGREGGAGAS
jgi:hypothetical protein